MALCCSRRSRKSIHIKNPSDAEIENRAREFMSAENRSCTDLGFLLLFGVSVAIMIGLTMYCSAHGNINRLSKGYDSCGNVCGLNNEKINISSRYLNSCQGADMTEKPYLLKFYGKQSSKMQRRCVRNCSEFPDDYQSDWRECGLSNMASSSSREQDLYKFLVSSAIDLETDWREILEICAIAFFLSYAILVISICAPLIAMYLANIAVLLLYGAVVVYAWITYHTTFELVVIVALTVILPLVSYSLWETRHRIQLAVFISNEFKAVIGDIPYLLALPGITMIFLLFAAGCCYFSLVLVGSSGILSPAGGGNYEYVMNETMIFTYFFNLLVILWFVQLVVVCQQCITAGTVSQWYFTRGEEYSRNRVWNSFKLFAKFHVGTAAFGSLMLALMRTCRFVISSVIHSLPFRANRFLVFYVNVFASICHIFWEKVMLVWSHRIFIVTEIYGYHFCKAWKTVHLILNNYFDTRFMEDVSDVFFFNQLIVVAVSTFVGFRMTENKSDNLYVTVIFMLFLSWFIADSVLSVHGITYDTIYICLCKDYSENDGVSKPFYMSQNLKGLVEKIKKSEGSVEHSSETPV